jgi:hypothetical protein
MGLLPDLKPCLLCGGEPEIRTTQRGDFIGCTLCGLNLPPDDDGNARQDHWNGLGNKQSDLDRAIHALDGVVRARLNKTPKRNKRGKSSLDSLADKMSRNSDGTENHSAPPGPLRAVCKYCGSASVSWKKENSKWTLRNGDGTAHRCQRSKSKTVTNG